MEDNPRSQFRGRFLNRDLTTTTKHSATGALSKNRIGPNISKRPAVHRSQSSMLGMGMSLGILVGQCQSRLGCRQVESAYTHPRFEARVTSINRLEDGLVMQVVGDTGLQLDTRSRFPPRHCLCYIGGCWPDSVFSSH